MTATLVIAGAPFAAALPERASATADARPASSGAVSGAVNQILDGGSLRPQDAPLVPDAAALPDVLTPPMLKDGAIDARPKPL